MSLSVDDRPVRSRRFARGQSPSRLGISLTGTHLTAWADESGSWVARARYDLVDDLDPRDESVLAGLAVEAPRNCHARRRLRAARPARRAAGDRRRRHAVSARAATSAHRDLRRTGVLRHRAHPRVGARPDDVRARAPRRPVLPAARPARRLRRPRDPPASGDGDAVAGGDQHVGRLRAAATRAVGVGRVAGHPRRAAADLLRGTARPRHPRRCRCRPTGCARSASGTRTWCAAATGSGWSASSARPGSSASTRRSRRGPTWTTSRCAAPRPTGGPPRAPRSSGSTASWRVLASDGRDGRRGQRARFPVFDLDLHRGRRAGRAVPDEPAVADARPATTTAG